MKSERTSETGRTGEKERTETNTERKEGRKKERKKELMN